MLRSRRIVGQLVTAPTISWGAVFSGVAVGTAILLTLTVLWLAIAGAVSGFRPVLPWIEAISSVAALFIAGLLAGWLSNVDGAAAGLGNGLTVWGLSAVAVTLTASPAIVRLSGVDLTPIGIQPVVTVSDAALWATFWSLIVGMVAASVGGLAGGAMHTSRTSVAIEGDETDAVDRGRVAPDPRYDRPLTPNGHRVVPDR